MKSIRKEMTRNHVILLLVAFIFIASNALVNGPPAATTGFYRITSR